ncbi:MAG: glycosyl hydrolase family 65 protein [Kouleothrix sp.]
MPQIPSQWAELRMPICWRGRQLRVVARPGALAVTLAAGEPLALAIGDGAWQQPGP